MASLKAFKLQDHTPWSSASCDLGSIVSKLLSGLKCDISLPSPSSHGCNWSPPSGCHTGTPDCTSTPPTSELVTTCLGQQGDTYEALDWVTGTGVTLYAHHFENMGPGNVPVFTTTILGDGINDAGDAAVFDPDVPAPEFPFGPEVWSTAKGIGVDNLSSVYSSGANGNNGEINAGPNGLPSDILGVDINKQVVSAKAELSLFYYADASSQPDNQPVIGAAARCETATITLGNDLNGNGLLDAGEILGVARIRADGVVVFATSSVGTMEISGHGIAPDQTAIAVGSGNDYKQDGSNGGLFEMEFALKDADGKAITFSFVEFSSGGLQLALSSAETSHTDPSDFLVRSLCYTEEIITIPEQPVCYEGLSHGYWKNHTTQWDGKGTDIVTAYDTKDSFESVFGVDVKGQNGSWTLQDALNAKGGGEMALAREAVAALLNASSGDINYLYTAQQVIDLVKDAYTAGGAYAKGDFEGVKDLLETQNTLELCKGHDLIGC